MARINLASLAELPLPLYMIPCNNHPTMPCNPSKPPLDPASTLATSSTLPTIAVPLELSVMRLKTAILWFPQTIFQVERNSGKTQALLEIIYGLHDGEAFLMSSSVEASEAASRRYCHEFRSSNRPRFIVDWQVTVGYSLPIYVDDWFNIEQSQQDGIMHTGHVVGRVGTPR